MGFEEYLHKVCTETDMNDADQATMLVQVIATEALRYRSLAMKQEEKLKETMLAKDYIKWTEETAKELFKEEIDRMDGDFKEFAKDHFDEIVGEKE